MIVRTWRIAGLGLLLGLAGCANHSQSIQGDNHPLPATISGSAADQSPTKTKPSTIPDMTAQLAGVEFKFSDPKTGKLIWTAVADSLNAQSGPGDSGVAGVLQNVTGTMYQKGVAVDRLKAERVTADQVSRTVSATGDVNVTTVGTEPTTMRCDRLIWNTGGNTMWGYGNVVLRRGGFIQTAPSFQADTAMRTVVMPAPGRSAPGRGPVRAVYAHSAASQSQS